MGFIKNQQVNLAIRLLAWQYERNGQTLPEKALLERHARQLVDDVPAPASLGSGEEMCLRF